MSQTKVARLCEGLKLIIEVDPDAEMDIHDNALYVGAVDSEAPADLVSKKLHDLGWTVHEDSWCFE